MVIVIVIARQKTINSCCIFELSVGHRYIHAVPHDVRSGQPKPVLVLNIPNVQDLYSCVYQAMKINVWLTNIQQDLVT